jgi:hypothetical protein
MYVYYFIKCCYYDNFANILLYLSCWAIVFTCDVYLVHLVMLTERYSEKYEVLDIHSRFPIKMYRLTNSTAQEPEGYHRLHNSLPPARILSQLNPLPPSQSPQDPLWSHPLIDTSVLKVVSFQRTFTLFSPLPCVLLPPPTSSSLTWSA